MRQIVQTKQFKKDFKKLSSSRYKLEDFIEVVELLVADKPLPLKNRDHLLTGEWQEYRECHIKPDWLLIYRKPPNVLELVRTGSHSELF